VQHVLFHNTGSAATALPHQVPWQRGAQPTAIHMAMAMPSNTSRQLKAHQFLNFMVLLEIPAFTHVGALKYTRAACVPWPSAPLLRGIDEWTSTVVFDTTQCGPGAQFPHQATSSELPGNPMSEPPVVLACVMAMLVWRSDNRFLLRCRVSAPKCQVRRLLMATSYVQNNPHQQAAVHYRVCAYDVAISSLRT